VPAGGQAYPRSSLGASSREGRPLRPARHVAITAAPTAAVGSFQPTPPLWIGRLAVSMASTSGTEAQWVRRHAEPGSFVSAAPDWCSSGSGGNPPRQGGSDARGRPESAAA
jgi:hypothetical protein